MKYLYLSLFLIGFVFSSCRDKDEPTVTVVDVTPRTVLLYMVGQNNLSGNVNLDLEEIKTAVLNGDLGDSRLLIYKDTPYNTPYLFEYTFNGTEIRLRDYDDETMSVSSERLVSVIEDVKTIAPAKTYGLIFWGHGSGYVQNGIVEENVISTLSYGGETIAGKSYWMNVTNMADVLKGRGFDWIYFDCCFMAGVEVVYELRDVADYIVASVSEIPANGMPYDKTLRYLMPQNSDLNMAAKSTFDYYDSMHGMYRTCTMSVMCTSGMDALASVMKNVYLKTDGLPDKYTPQQFQTDDDHSTYGWSYYDLDHYANALSPNDTDIIKAAINGVVKAAYATPKLWNEVLLSNHCGLSTLIIESPYDQQLDRFGYRQLQWWNDVVAPRFNNK